MRHDHEKRNYRKNVDLSKLGISFKGKQQFAIAIVKEERDWKLDER